MGFIQNIKNIFNPKPTQPTPPKKEPTSNTPNNLSDATKYAQTLTPETYQKVMTSPNKNVGGGSSSIPTATSSTSQGSGVNTGSPSVMNKPVDASFTSQGSTYNPATGTSTINKPQALGTMSLAQATTFGSNMTPQQYESFNQSQLPQQNKLNTNVTSISGGIKQDFRELFSNKIDVVPDKTYYAFTNTIDTGLNTYVRPALGSKGKDIFDWGQNIKVTDPLRTMIIPLAFGSAFAGGTTGLKTQTTTIETSSIIQPVKFKGVINIKSENTADVVIGGQSGKQTFFSQQKLKVFGDSSIGIEKGFKISIPDKFTTDVTLFRGGGGSKTIGTGTRYSKGFGSTTNDMFGVYKFTETKGIGTASTSSSVAQDIGGLSIRKNLVGQTKGFNFATDTTPIKTNAVGILEETSNPNVFRYSGTTDNILRIYKGGTSKIGGNVNIQGLIKVNYPTSSSGEIFNIPNTINQKSISTITTKAISPVISPTTATKTTIQFATPSVATSNLIQSSAFAGLGQYERTNQASALLPQLRQDNKNVLISIPKFDNGLKSNSGLMTSVIPRLITPSRTTTTPRLDQPLIPKLGNPQKTNITPETKVPTIPVAFSTPRFTDTPMIPFAFTLPNFDAGKMKNRRYKGKQRLKYTPDFSSIFSGRIGKAPKGRLTGLEARPITKGFSWSYNNPKGYNFLGNVGNFLKKRRKKWRF